MNTLNLTLRKKWFDLIASGEKTEEYREIKPYWIHRLATFYRWLYPDDINNTFDEIAKPKHPDTHQSMFNFSGGKFKHFDTITFRNGYAKNAPTVIVECKGITIGTCRPEWSDNAQGDHFIISLGKILSIT